MAKLLLKVNEQSLTVEYDIPKIVENSINYLEYEVIIPDGSETWESCESFQIFFTGENGSLPPSTTLSGNIPSEVIKAPGFAVTVVGTGADNYFVPTESVVIQVFPNDTYNNVIDPPEGETLQNWYEELLSASQTAINDIKRDAGATIIQLEADAADALETYKNAAYGSLTEKYNEIESDADEKLAKIEEDAGTAISDANKAVSDANDKINIIERRATEAIEKIESAADTKIIDLNQVDYDINAWELDEGTYIVLPDEDYEHYVWFNDFGDDFIGEGHFTLKILSDVNMEEMFCVTGTGYIFESSENDGNYLSFIYNSYFSGEPGYLPGGALAIEDMIPPIISSSTVKTISSREVEKNTAPIAVGTFKNYVDSNINELSNNIISTSKNLYNEMTNKIDTDIDIDNNEIQRLNWSLTDYIYLDIGIYALTYSQTPLKHFYEIVLYNLNKERYNSNRLDNSNFFTKYENENKVTFEINKPSYVRFRGLTKNISEIMLVKGTELPSEYIPYKNELKLDVLPTKNIVKTITESCNAWELEDGIYMIDPESAVVTFGHDVSAGEFFEGWCGIFSVYASQENEDGKVIFAQYTDTIETKEKVVWLCVDAEGIIIQHFDLTNQNGTNGDITVDSAMSDTSTNPVQNKVVYAFVNDIASQAVRLMEAKDTAIVKEIEQFLTENAVIKEDGKGLSTNDFTDEDKIKLDNSVSKEYVDNNFVAEEQGKGLSTNDFTDEYKTKLDDSASKKYVDEQISKIEIPEITVDDELSDTSENPVQNKVVMEGFRDVFDEVQNRIEEIAPTLEEFSEYLDTTITDVESNLKSYVDEVIGGIENGSY
jgi:hypothetical protein